MYLLNKIVLIIAIIVLFLVAVAILAMLIMNVLFDLYSAGVIDDCFLCKDKNKGMCKECRYSQKRREGHEERI